MLAPGDWTFPAAHDLDAKGVSHTSPGQRPGFAVPFYHCRPTACFIKLAKVGSDALTEIYILYAAVSQPSHPAQLMRYIDHQEQHHRTQTCQEEYRNLLSKYHVEFEER